MFVHSARFNQLKKITTIEKLVGHYFILFINNLSHYGQVPVKNNGPTITLRTLLRSFTPS